MQPGYCSAPLDGGGGDGRAASVDGEPGEVSLSFLAVLPQIAGAVKAHGDGSLRVTLEISEQEKPNAVALLALTGEILRVTVEVVKLEEVDGERESESEGRDGGRTVRRSAAKRRVGAGGAGV